MDEVLEVDEFKKKLQEFDSEQASKSQIEPKVRVKRMRGVLKSIKQLMEGKELSVEDICLVLESSGVKKESVQSMLSNYTRKGQFVKTDKGYKLSEVEPCL